MTAAVPVPQVALDRAGLGSAGLGSAGLSRAGLGRLAGGAWVVAVVFVALELAVSGRYGFQQDELYFIAAGGHPALGYVDQGPLVPLLVWLATRIAHDPTAVRVLPALAGGGVVVCSAVAARTLGGGRFAQVLAAVATACAPVVLGAAHLSTTTPFDLLAWAGALTLVLVAVTHNRPRLWLAAGVVTGLGLENKNLPVLMLVALLIGLGLSSQRRVLATRWPWLGLAIALAIWAPELYWQATHYLRWPSAQGFPALAMSGALRAEHSSTSDYITAVPAQLIYIGLLSVPLAALGIVRLSRQPATRFAGIGAALLLVYVIADIPGRPYYADGFAFLVLAAGAVAVEAAGGPSRRWLWVAAPVAGALVVMPAVLPVLPVSDLHQVPGLPKLNTDIGDTVGWPQLTAQVAAAYRAIPPAQRAQASIFTGDYGEAAAIAWFGSAYDLPYPLSGHNNFALWGPGHAPDTTVVAVGSVDSIRDHFRSCAYISTFRPPGQVSNDQSGTQIWRCSGPDVTWSAIWPGVRYLG